MKDILHYEVLLAISYRLYCVYTVLQCIYCTCTLYILGCGDCFCGHVSLLHQVTKLNNVLQIWNKPAWMRASDHSKVTV